MQINQSQDKLLMDIADKIINSRDSLRIPPALPYYLGKVTNCAYSSVGRRLLGKIFIADEKCNACGKCSRLCPVKNIEMKGKAPKWNWHCEGCQRCINACPAKSIQASTIRLVTMLAMQLVPIYLVIRFNNKLPVNFAIDLLLYAIFAYILTAANDYIISILEQLAPTRRIMQLNFTHKFKRYLSKDIQY